MTAHHHFKSELEIPFNANILAVYCTAGCLVLQHFMGSKVSTIIPFPTTYLKNLTVEFQLVSLMGVEMVGHLYKFQSLDVVSRYRDPQLQVTENLCVASGPSPSLTSSLH